MYADGQKCQVFLTLFFGKGRFQWIALLRHAICPLRPGLSGRQQAHLKRGPGPALLHIGEPGGRDQ